MVFSSLFFRSLFSRILSLNRTIYSGIFHHPEHPLPTSVFFFNSGGTLSAISADNRDDRPLFHCCVILQLLFPSNGLFSVFTRVYAFLLFLSRGCCFDFQDVFQKDFGCTFSRFQHSLLNRVFRVCSGPNN